jgi:peptidoglycan/xylan/chitin deacetylase (PgdA/CDA1 family)
MRVFSPFRWLAPAGAAGQLSIFIFHRVLPEVDALRPGEPDPSRFEHIVKFLVRYFQVLPLSQAVRALRDSQLPRAAACITFDDGYLDNLTTAAPILRRHGASATVFVATGFSGGDCMFNDKVIEAVRALSPGDGDWREFGLGQYSITDDASRVQLIRRTLGELKYRPVKQRAEIAGELARRAGVGGTCTFMMSAPQLAEWHHLGFEVGGHTVRHPILARLSEADAYAEICDGRHQLKEWLGAAPEAFAYPNGIPGQDYGPRDVELVKRAGYSSAFSTARGAAAPGADFYQLPRFTPWDQSMWAFGLRCAQTLVATRRTGRRTAAENNKRVRA